MHRSFIDRLLLPAIFGLTTIIAALVLWQLLLTNRRVEIQTNTKEQALFVKAKTESELSARILSLERLAGRWQEPDRLADQDMESDASLVMSGYPAYQAIEWIDPTFHVVWVEPARGNERDVDADLGADPHQRVKLEDAIDSGTVTATPPTNLRQGGRGFLVFVPVYSQTKLRGFLVGVFRYQPLLSSILQDVAPDYWVVVSDGHEAIYSRTLAGTVREGPYAQEADIQVEGLSWEVKAWPKTGVVAYARSPLPTLVFGGGILMAVVLGFAVYMTESSLLHVRKLQSSNRELQKEIAGREQAEEALTEKMKEKKKGNRAAPSPAP